MIAEECCTIDARSDAPPATCPQCGTPGRSVAQRTLKALLRPGALAQLAAPAHRFCAEPACPVVYFGARQAFTRADVREPVFQKEPPGERMVCYCFGVTENAIREDPGTPAWIAALVKAGRCACELRNPQGSCCLGHVTALARGATPDGGTRAGRAAGRQGQGAR